MVIQRHSRLGRLIHLYAFLAVFTLGCKPEDMRSNNVDLGQELGSPGEPSGSTYSEHSDSKSSWEEAHKDPTKWINDQMSPLPICGQSVTAPTPVNLANQNALDVFVKDAFERDESCRVVFTGNAGNTEKADITYAKAMAHAMAQDMCSKNETHNAFLKDPQNSDDALYFDHFNGKSLVQKSENNVVATYALTYALGYRESSGNFIQPRDPWARPLNTGNEEETGFTQTSANSMNPQKSKVAKDIFKQYVSSLSRMNSQAEMAKFCLNDKLEGNKQTRRVENDSRGRGENIPFDHEGKGLYGLFQNEGSSCKKISQKVKGSFVAINNPNDSIVKCFKDLHKNCPGFSIKYAAAIARTNRRHHGPFRSGQSKPPPRPSCQKLFNSIAENEKAVCDSLANKPVNLEVASTAQTKTDELLEAVKPEAAKPGDLLKAPPDSPEKFPTIEVKSDRGTGAILKPTPSKDLQLRETRTESGSPVLVLEEQPSGPPNPSAPPEVLPSDDYRLFKNYEKLGGDPVAFQQAMCFLKSKGSTSFKSFGEGYRNGIKIENQRYVTIQDLTKPSSEKRLFILDRETGSVEVLHSGHGIGVYPYSNSRDVAKNFSNTTGSLKTPSGFFITGNTYNSSKSWRVGMRLHGLQQGINDRTFARGVVLHGGPYVTDGVAKDTDSSPRLKGNSCGRSHGCTVVNSNQIKSVMSKLAAGKEGDYPYRGGALYYNFSPSEKSKGPNYCGDQLVPEVSK